MSTDNLFPEEPKRQKRKKLQYQLLDHLRMGKTITEDYYQKQIGGKSVSAAIHNLRMRGHFEPGEFIVHEKVRDDDGFLTPGYRLAKETPSVDFPQKEQEIDPGVFGKNPDIRFFAKEPAIDEFATEPLRGGLPSSEYPAFKEEAEDIKFEPEVPEVSSIMVGVRGSQPELVIMFKGDFKPLRHLLTNMEVQYLSINLEPFKPKRRD